VFAGLDDSPHRLRLPLVGRLVGLAELDGLHGVKEKIGRANELDHAGEGGGVSVERIETHCVVGFVLLR